MDQGKLQIETNFFGEEDNLDIGLVTHSQVENDPKKNSAELIEKSLSCILSRNFIECWTELKRFYYHENYGYGINSVKKIKERQKEGFTLDAIENKKCLKYSSSQK